MNKPPLNEQCANCRYWWPSSDDNMGDCKRFPPTPLFGAYLGQPGDDIPAPVFIFPKTVEFDWCGEFDAAVVAEQT